MHTPSNCKLCEQANIAYVPPAYSRAEDLDAILDIGPAPSRPRIRTGGGMIVAILLVVAAIAIGVALAWINAADAAPQYLMTAHSPKAGPLHVQLLQDLEPAMAGKYFINIGPGAEMEIRCSK